MDALLGALEDWEAEHRRREAERLAILADLHELALGDGNAQDNENGVGAQDEVQSAAGSDVQSAAGSDVQSAAGSGVQSAAGSGDHPDARRSQIVGRGRELAYRSLRYQVALALGQSEYVAERDLNLAFETRHTLPATHDALRAGTLTLPHARIIVEEAVVFQGGTAQDSEAGQEPQSEPGMLAGVNARRSAFEQDAIRLGAGETPNRFRPIARRLAAQYAAKTLSERHQEARRRRCVRLLELDEGMAELRAVLPAEEAHEAWDRLTRIAKLTPAGRASEAKRNGAAGASPAEGASGERSRDEIRADVYADLLLGRNEAEYRGIQGRIQVIAPGSILGIPGLPIPVARREGPTAGSVTGSATEPGSNSTPGGVAESGLELPGETANAGTLVSAPVAELIGYGPIDLDTVKRIAGSAERWEEIRVTIDGQIMETKGYAPSTAQRRYLSARDQHCRAPGCRVPTHRCDIDHTIDAAKGGPTRIDNLAHLCRSHHVLKHHSDWAIKQDANGDLTWTDPTGRKYVDRPPSRVRFVPVVEPGAREPADQPAGRSREELGDDPVPPGASNDTDGAGSEIDDAGDTGSAASPVGTGPTGPAEASGSSENSGQVGPSEPGEWPAAAAAPETHPF